MKKTNAFLNWGGAFIGLSTYFFYKALDRMVNYENPDYEDNYINVHVGGDAYNYIINGTHATVFSLIGIGLFLAGLLFILFHYHMRLLLEKEERVLALESAAPPEPYVNPNPEAEAFVQEYKRRQREEDSDGAP